MAIKPCRECFKEVSDTASACPHCGAKQGGILSAINKTGGNVVTIFIILAVIVVFVIT